jgi:tubulin-folding cofactor B
MSEFGLGQEDHDMVKAYVTGADHMQYQNIASGTVAILMTHSNLAANHLDIRLDLHLTIEGVKGRFKTHVGTPVDHQRLILKSNGRVICEMSDNNKKLGYYSVVSGNEIHIIDTDPFSLSRGGGLTDTSLVEKYRMSEEAYDQRKGTMRDYIREQRKADPNFKLKPNAQAAAMNKQNSALNKAEATGPPPGVETVAGIEVGSRCECNPGARRGVVKYVGEIEQIAAGGHWVGVQFDEPLGHNDGTCKGVTIFEGCPEGHGAFVRGKNVTVGDFPEIDLFGDDDSEDEI